MDHADRVCQVSCVRVYLPAKKLRRLFDNPSRLEPGIFVELRRKREEIEKNIFILQHALSVVDQIMLKS